MVRLFRFVQLFRWFRSINYFELPYVLVRPASFWAINKFCGLGRDANACMLHGDDGCNE